MVLWRIGFTDAGFSEWDRLDSWKMRWLWICSRFMIICFGRRFEAARGFVRRLRGFSQIWDLTAFAHGHQAQRTQRVSDRIHRISGIVFMRGNGAYGTYGTDGGSAT